MAKASLTLPNGTVVQIEGTVEEVHALLAHYGSVVAPSPASRSEKRAPPTEHKRRKTKASSNSSQSTGATNGAGTTNLAEIVNLTKSCNEAENIEAQILDRASQVDRRYCHSISFMSI